MIKIKEIALITNHINISNEVFINLKDLNDILNSSAGQNIEMEECIITPYYIKDGKRLELYEYEFNVESENGYDFDEYILNMTGKERIGDISKDIVKIRKICYAKCYKGSNSDVLNKLKEFLHFLFKNKKLHKEIRQIFGNYSELELYAIIY